MRGRSLAKLIRDNLGLSKNLIENITIMSTYKILSRIRFCFTQPHPHSTFGLFMYDKLKIHNIDHNVILQKKKLNKKGIFKIFTN